MKTLCPSQQNKLNKQLKKQFRKIKLLLKCFFFQMTLLRTVSSARCLAAGKTVDAVLCYGWAWQSSKSGSFGAAPLTSFSIASLIAGQSKTSAFLDFCLQWSTYFGPKRAALLFKLKSAEQLKPGKWSPLNISNSASNWRHRGSTPQKYWSSRDKIKSYFYNTVFPSESYSWT